MYYAVSSKDLLLKKANIITAGSWDGGFYVHLFSNHCLLCSLHHTYGTLSKDTLVRSTLSTSRRMALHTQDCLTIENARWGHKGVLTDGKSMFLDVSAAFSTGATLRLLIMMGW